MTPEQFERWQDFALRAAQTWYKTHRRPDAAWVAGVVSTWFDYFDVDSIPCIVDWNNSSAYPEGNPSHGREYNATRCGCDGYWYAHKRPNPNCSECHGLGKHYALRRAPYLCDTMTEFLGDYRGYAPRCRACTEDENKSACRCEEIADRYYAQWDGQWGGPVRCCIRAGLDLAANPSAGVVGFTAGDIRSMYPEGVPEWVQNGDWSTQTFGECQVGLIPLDEPHDPRPFDTLPDDAHVWL